MRRACDAAVRSPLAQFLFIDRYTRWNGYVGALVAKLAGNIGESQDLFLDADEPDRAQAVRGMDVARRVLDATVDEHDAHALLRDMGTHIASESLADREYALIDRVFRAEPHHEGFYQYLRERDYRVELSGLRVHAYAWITLHATFDANGIEAERLDEAMAAITLTERYRPESRAEVLTLAREGFRTFADMQRDFFAETERECLAAEENALTA